MAIKPSPFFVTILHTSKFAEQKEELKLVGKRAVNHFLNIHVTDEALKRPVLTHEPITASAPQLNTTDILVIINGSVNGMIPAKARLALEKEIRKMFRALFSEANIVVILSLEGLTVEAFDSHKLDSTTSVEYARHLAGIETSDLRKKMVEIERQRKIDKARAAEDEDEVRRLMNAGTPVSVYS